MDAPIAAELGMEGCGHDLSLPHHNRLLALGREHLYTGADAGDLGSPDEDHFNGRALERTFSNGTINLATVSVAANTDINCAETSLLRVVYFLGEKDRTGASPEGGFQSNELL